MIIFACAHTHTHTHTYHTHTHISHTHTYHTHIYIYICMYIYITEYLCNNKYDVGPIKLYVEQERSQMARSCAILSSVILTYSFLRSSNDIDRKSTRLN